MRYFHVQRNVGHARYFVSFHNGKSKHSDGSDFMDARIFQSKRDTDSYVKRLKACGYVEGLPQLHLEIDETPEVAPVKRQTVGKLLTETQATWAAATLIGHSVWLEVEPWPDGLYMVTVKNEPHATAILDKAEGLGNG